MRSISEFIKYNNTVPIIAAVLLLGTGAVFAANPNVREALFPTDSGPIGPPPKAETGILRATDIQSFDMAFRVDTVKERADSYQVAYSYRTLEVADQAWQAVSKAKVMDVPKALLGKRDLGLYAAEQIGQVMDREIAYLSEVQAGLTAPTTAGDDAGRYSRLAGKALDPEDRGFDGYKPVVKGEEEEKPPTPATTVSLPGTDSPVQTVLSKEEVRQIIVDSIANFLAIDTAPLPSTADPVVPEPLPEVLPDDPAPEEVPESVPDEAPSESVPSAEAETGEEGTETPPE